MQDILKRLGISDTNPGTWLGSASLEDPDGDLIESVNPATGEVISRVRGTTESEYAQVIDAATEAAAIWSNTPAPVRGDAIRKVGQALRQNKDALGSLVATENGKF